jgi:hypothetical protein
VILVRSVEEEGEGEEEEEEEEEAAIAVVVVVTVEEEEEEEMWRPCVDGSCGMCSKRWSFPPAGA